MISEEKRLLLVELSRSSNGEALRALLEEAYNELGDVTKCTNWEDTVGRKHSMLFLRKTFSFLDKQAPKETPKTQYT